MVVSLKKEWSNTYDSFLQGHGQSTFFHRRSWIEILQDVLNKEVFTLASIEQEKSVRGILSLALCRTLSGKALVSLPFRDQGGPLVCDASALVELIAEAKDLALKVGASRLTFQRVGNEYNECMRSQGFVSSLRGVETRLDLSSFSDAESWQQL